MGPELEVLADEARPFRVFMELVQEAKGIHPSRCGPGGTPGPYCRGAAYDP
jgi:hypothetical protein